MKTNMKTKKIVAGLVLVSGGFFSAGASAAVIGAWDWRTNGGFVEGASSCNNGGEAACNIQYDNVSGETPSTLPGTSSIMTWGTGSTTNPDSNGEQSGLQGIFGASGDGPYDAELLGSGAVPIPTFEQIITNAGWTNTGAAVHYNNIITAAGGFMDYSILRTTFQLLTPGPGPIDEADLEIVFNETLNAAPCVGDNPHGTVCDDIFTLSATLVPIMFNFGGVAYTASFRFFGGDGAIVDGDTIFTAEDAPGTAVVHVQARIDAVESVPLPGILALMGMGLMMLGWRVREREVS